MNADAVGTGQLKGCMLLANARLSNTKTPRQGKFAFRLTGSGSSTKQRHTALDGRTSRPGAGVWMALVWSHRQFARRPTTGPSELKFILSGRTREETIEWVAALERLGVPSSFDPLLLPPLQGLHHHFSA